MKAVETHQAEIAAALKLFPATDASSNQVFGTPWQARVFALIVALVKQNHLTWQDFQTRLAQEITESTDPRKDDPGQVEAHYFECWLHAVETTLKHAGFLEEMDLPQKIHTLQDSVKAIREQQLHGKQVHVE